MPQPISRSSDASPLLLQIELSLARSCWRFQCFGTLLFVDIRLRPWLVWASCAIFVKSNNNHMRLRSCSGSWLYVILAPFNFPVRGDIFSGLSADLDGHAGLMPSCVHLSALYHHGMISIRCCTNCYNCCRLPCSEVVVTLRGL